MRKNKGFTLLEVIVSVAALSLISMFILQMFMVSARLNERAKNTDIALANIISELERVKSGSEFDTLIENNKVLYYNADWNNMTTSSSEANFLLTVSIVNIENGLYTVLADVVDLRPGENNRVLASLEMKKYWAAAMEVTT